MSPEWVIDPTEGVGHIGLTGFAMSNLSSITATMAPFGEREPRPAPASPPRVTIASQEPGRFELVSELARGGMGRIMEAWDPRHERKVAIKLLLQRSDEAAKRFAREARITGRLQHPAIVPLYEAGRTPSGEPFYAMKLVDGRSLGEALLACSSLEERLSLLPHMIAVTDALAYAHARRIIHRDLKPSNVLLGAFGETIVIDWGLAKDLDEAEGEEGTLAALTRGRPIGTPRYMPPEQARGEATDERADVYALGAMLYHLLGGSAPYRELSARQALEAVRVRPPMPLAQREPRLPRELLAIVARAMARKPKDRYPNARALANDLKRFSAARIVASQTRARSLTAHRGVAGLTAAVGVALAIGIVLAAVVVVRALRVDHASSAVEVAVARGVASLLADVASWNS